VACKESPGEDELSDYDIGLLTSAAYLTAERVFPEWEDPNPYRMKFLPVERIFAVNGVSDKEIRQLTTEWNYYQWVDRLFQRKPET